MASKISIINMALGWLGAPPIASLQEKRPEAIYAVQYYDSALETTLRDHPWNFAQKRASLAPIDVPPGYAGVYENAYAMPVDVVKAHKVIDASENDFSFVLALSEDGGAKIILTNVESAFLAYTALVAIPELYDPDFVRALARRLAADIATPILKNNPQKVQEAETLYDRAIGKARLSDYREGKPEDEEDVSWIQARTAR